VWFATGTGFSRVPPFLEIGRVNAHDAGLQPAGGTNLDSMSSDGLCCDHPNMMAEILSSVGNRLSRCEVAWHEAGHAVLAALLGQPIEWVIIDEASGCGEVEPKTGPFFRLDEPFESRRRFLIAMAGSVAQCLAVGCECRWMPGSDGDKQRAEDYADLAGLRPDDFSMVLAILSRPHVWKRSRD
jgi:hypothetical protein